MVMTLFDKQLHSEISLINYLPVAARSGVISDLVTWGCALKHKKCNRCLLSLDLMILMTCSSVYKSCEISWVSKDTFSLWLKSDNLAYTMQIQSLPSSISPIWVIPPHVGKNRGKWKGWKLNPGHLGLNHQCYATDSQQPDDHQPSQSYMYCIFLPHNI